MRIVAACAGLVLGLSSLGCAQSPAASSPLKDKLAQLDDGQLESIVRACLEKDGWTVDPLPSQHGDITRIHASKREHVAALYLYPRDMVPRITGDLSDSAFPLWSCLRSASPPTDSAQTP